MLTISYTNKEEIQITYITKMKTIINIKFY